MLSSILLAAAMPGIFTMVIYVVVFVLVLSLLYYVITKHAPEPIKGYAITIVVVGAVLCLLYVLLQLAGGGGLNP